MPNPLAVRMAKPAITRWLASSAHSWRTLEMPPHRDTQHSRGPDPDRILLIGSGMAVGYGLTSHDTALAGQLAQQITALTHRGSRVDVLTSVDMTADQMVEFLDRPTLDGLDAIIATPLGVESLLIISRARWRRHLRLLLTHISATAPVSVQLYLVGIPPVADLSDLPPMLAAHSRRAQRRLNLDLEKFCAAHPQATFVPLGHVPRADASSTEALYAGLARVIAPEVAAGLNRQTVR
jgi:hypothetical protein